MAAWLLLKFTHYRCNYLRIQAPEDEEEDGNTEEADIAAFVARSKKTTAQAKASKAMAKLNSTEKPKTKAAPKVKK
jgi:hypothetical protein